MSADPSRPLGSRPCRHLRSKEMFYHSAAVENDPRGSGIFWCHRTQNCLGPDQKPASSEDCGPGRGCYDPV